MFSPSIYIERRKVLKEKVKSGLILLLGNNESPMNYTDNTYHFRQDSSFLYYFGLDLPKLAAVINIDEDTETIFGNELTIDDIVWTGPLPTLKAQSEKAGVYHTQPFQELKDVITKAVGKGQAIHFLPPYRHDNAILLWNFLGIAPAELKEKSSMQLVKAVIDQRSIKAPEEVAELEKAVNISGKMHLAAMEIARPGMTEAQVMAAVQQVALAENVHISYPVILTVRGEVLHNHSYHHILEKGQMVLCDAGGESLLHYAGDITRTFPVAETFNSQQKQMYQIVLDAQQKAIEALKPGVLFKDIHLLASKALAEGMKALGVMHGDLDEAIEEGAHAMFFQCGLGHMMGLDVHDMEDLGEEYVGYDQTTKKSKQFGLKSLRLGKALEPGFVVTVEPGLYLIPELIDMWKAEKKFEAFINYDELEKYRNFSGIRVEDNFLITATGSKLLGDPIPKSLKDIEQIRSGLF